MTLYLPLCQLSVIAHISTNQVSRCWADGGFEKLKRVPRWFFLVSASSLLFFVQPSGAPSLARFFARLLDLRLEKERKRLLRRLHSYS